MEALQPGMRAIDRLFRVLSFAAGIILLAMMIHVSLDVFSKYVFNYPIPGTLEIVSAHYMVFSVFLPLGLVEWGRKSIAVDLLYNLLPRPVKLVLIALVLAAMAVIYGALTMQTWEDALDAYARQDYLFGGSLLIETWQSRFALPLGFGAACLVTAWQFLGVVLGFDRESWLITHVVSETDLE